MTTDQQVPANQPPVFGLVGWHNAGKTTAMVNLVEELTGRGLDVSTIKHAHHGFDVDQPGKDSYRHRSAGATEVLVASDRRWALMHELYGRPEPDLDTLLGHLAPVDLVIVEGFKHAAIPKLEIYRPAPDNDAQAKLLACDDPHIIAVAAAEPGQLPDLPDRDIVVLDLADRRAIADFIMTNCGLKPPQLHQARL
ncbi:MAG: molybdopterin-guanine dinucleotide biosynthesis protein B [Alphaproteobacteria bacterium]|nr:molybdopterin-guanine dinucleotide biosynthesis protein B [Alphaproteobacteria bacterium]